MHCHRNYCVIVDRNRDDVTKSIGFRGRDFQCIVAVVACCRRVVGARWWPAFDPPRAKKDCQLQCGAPSLPKRPWTSEDEQKLLALHACGLSWLLIARELQRSEASVIGRYATKLKKRKIVRKPVLRLPFQDPLLLRAEAAIADCRKLKNRLLESRWKAVALESQLQYLVARVTEQGCGAAVMVALTHAAGHVRSTAEPHSEYLQADSHNPATVLANHASVPAQTIGGDRPSHQIGVRRGAASVVRRQRAAQR